MIAWPQIATSFLPPPPKQKNCCFSPLKTLAALPSQGCSSPHPALTHLIVMSSKQATGKNNSNWPPGCKRQTITCSCHVVHPLSVVGTLKDGYIHKVPLRRATRIQHASHTSHVTHDTCYLEQVPRIPTWSDLTRSLAGLGRRMLLPFSLALM